MNKTMLVIALAVTVLLASCGKLDNREDITYQVAVTNLRTERSEKRYDALKWTRVTYNTSASLEVTDATGGKPSCILYLTAVDETGFSASGTTPNIVALVVDRGMGELKISVTKKIPDGQAIPPPPKYAFLQVLLDTMEPAMLATSDTETDASNKSDITTFYLTPQQVRVVGEEEAYFAKVSVPVKELGSRKKQSLQLFVRVKTTSHPSKEHVGRVEYASALVADGIGMLEQSEYLSLKSEYNKDFEEVETSPPDPPQYEYSLVGFQSLKNATVIKK